MQSDIREGELVFSFQDARSLDKFDDVNTHGMAHAMKAVDFLAAFGPSTWLMEVKDPEDSGIPPEHANKERVRFLSELQSKKLVNDVLAPKLRDTLVYLALAHRAPTNRILYIAVIAVAELDSALLLAATEALKAKCYLPGPFKQLWASNFDVVVVNLESFNRAFEPHSVTRQPPNS